MRKVIKTNNESVTFADRIKVTVECWPSGKVRWEISAAGETAEAVLSQIAQIENQLIEKYKKV